MESLLGRTEVDVNSRSVLGSSPAMVAAKYASTEALQVSPRTTVRRPNLLLPILMP